MRNRQINTINKYVFKIAHSSLNLGKGAERLDIVAYLLVGASDRVHA
jgi:hypothetical protein